MASVAQLNYPQVAEPLPDKFPFKLRKNHAKRATAMTQIIQLQDQAHKVALDPETPVKDRAALMRAWCDLQEEKRKLRMQPLPKPVDVSKLGKGKRKTQAGPAYQEPEPKQAPEPTTGSVQPAKTEQGKAP